MNAGKSIFALAVILFILPVTADAQYEMQKEFQAVDSVDSSSGSYSLGTYMDNPCTAVQDWTLVDYDVYLYEEYRLAMNGGRFFFDESTTVSSSKYAASGSTHSDVAYSTPFTLRKYHKVNTSDNFHVVTVIDFDPASRTSYLSVETACGNGMPDSTE